MADGSIASVSDLQLAREEGASFADRHIGPDAVELAAMLDAVGAPSLDALIERTVPASIAHGFGEGLPRPLSEIDTLAELRALARENVPVRSLIGCGYHGTHVPPVIARNVLENPAWYTAYTPYQAEIAQGRLEALLNFQTMVANLTGLPVANASLLDEATAVAEAIAMAQALARKGARAVVLANDLHPQTHAVVATRAAPLRTPLTDYAAGDLGALRAALERAGSVACVVLQYPGTTGGLRDLTAEIEAVHEAGALAIVSADPLALVMLASPGSQGADVVVGSAQRFGVPMGFGGPHAAFFATREQFRRALPGRIVGVSVDAAGRPAMRLALQTREQHIRREKATSNICTAQVLLAVMAGFYAVWHGPEGLRAIAARVHGQARRLAEAARAAGMRLRHDMFFDTVTIEADDVAGALRMRALAAGFNIRDLDGAVSIAIDETVSDSELTRLISALGLRAVEQETDQAIVSERLARREALLPEAVFSSHRSEHEMLRYIKRLADRDIALDRSMIPLGSCTMKLNATAEMLPVSWPEFMDLHPFAPAEQTMGTRRMIARLESWLAAATGFASVSLQPNAGSQGELAGLLAIRAFHANRGDEARDVCLIPASAHGTNPASAAMTGMRVVVVACDRQGNIDLEDLRAKASAHAERLAALMVTYPSTHGVFEEGIGEVCHITHEAGGQVYMDGANLNAQLGLTTPASVGADVCHLNLHKTFCIPHGGGGPGVGPIAVAPHLAAFLPNHPFRDDAGPATGIGPVAAAPFGSAGILPISYAYVRMMGAAGLKRASETAILAANYVAARLRGHYEVVYLGAHGFCAHECIVDCRPFEAEAGIKVEDIAKRLQDYGFHAPTMSWPVPGTLMIEPTESETRAEMDRFCDAMIAIRGEIARVASGAFDRSDNPLRNAPHTAEEVTGDEWGHPYRRAEAAYPLPFVRANKYWPPVKRVDNVYGDRNLVCTCAPLEAYGE